MRRTKAYDPIGLTHIGTLLAEAIGDSHRIREALGVWPAWEQAVGTHIANAARPVSLRDGVLTVNVRNSVWMQELTAMRDTVLRRVRRIASARIVREVRFRVGTLPNLAEVLRAEAPTLRLRAPIPYEMAQVIRRIEAPRLRTTLLRVVARWAALPHD